jgi:4-diphosphocytidyl-2-C-methyl-D-erythritol kinase
MKIIAPAKVNLMLQYVDRLPDGYHLLQSAVAFADIGDELEIAPADVFSLQIAGPFAAHAPAGPDNLVTRAAAGAKIAITLSKNIPAGAGLGGGSADAAAILKYLGTRDAKAAARLGADVPVSLKSIAQWMEGTGDVIRDIAMKPLHAVLVWPGQGLSTPDMYAALRASGQPFHAPIPRPRQIDPDFLKKRQNDFTAIAMEKLPVIADILRDLADQEGAEFSRLSGSGSACFGIYRSAQDAKKAADALSAAYPQSWVRPCVLR